MSFLFGKKSSPSKSGTAGGQRQEAMVRAGDFMTKPEKGWLHNGTLLAHGKGVYYCFPVRVREISVYPCARCPILKPHRIACAHLSKILKCNHNVLVCWKSPSSYFAEHTVFGAEDRTVQVGHFLVNFSLSSTREAIDRCMETAKLRKKSKRKNPKYFKEYIAGNHVSVAFSFPRMK